MNKIFILFVIRIFAAIGSLAYVSAVLRILPIKESGSFFVFLACAQFASGAMLGSLATLSIRYGSIYYSKEDQKALGRLVLFGGFCIIITMSALLLLPHFIPKHIAKALGNIYVFSSVVGLNGLLLFLSGLARVSGKVIYSIIPEYLFRPYGLAAAVWILSSLGVTSSMGVYISYFFVLLICCLFLASLIPWQKVQISFDKLFLNIKTYFCANIPLLINGLAATALSTLDIIFISQFVSVEFVSTYKAAAQYSMLLTTGVIISNLIYGPEIAVSYKNNDSSRLQCLAKYSSRVAISFFALMFLPLLAGPLIFDLLFGNVGAKAWFLTIILSAGRFFNSWYGSITTLANLTGNTMLIVNGQSVSIVFMIILAPIFSKYFSGVGIAVVATLTHIAWVTISTVNLQSKLKISLGPV